MSDIRTGPIAAISPKFAEGYARIRDVIDADGACPAYVKALAIACAAAVKGQRELAHRELDRSHRLGLSHAEAQGATLAVLISRGEAAYDTLTAAISAVFPTAIAHAAAVAEFAVDRESALDYFRSYFGHVPAYIELMADEAPRALEGYVLMRQWSMGENTLDPKTVELIFLTINAAEFAPRFVGVHAAGARKAGATEAEIVEAVLCAIPVAGLAAWLPAADAIAGR
jgi:alkylhydroperoxidase/carboxymuconolactone decarboxylase family protein YurZ